jgi:hypothetical protein
LVSLLRNKGNDSQDAVDKRLRLPSSNARATVAVEVAELPVSGIKAVPEGLCCVTKQRLFGAVRCERLALHIARYLGEQLKRLTGKCSLVAPFFRLLTNGCHLLWLLNGGFVAVVVIRGLSCSKDLEIHKPSQFASQISKDELKRGFLSCSCRSVIDGN